MENGNLLHTQLKKKCSRILLAVNELNLANIKVFFKYEQQVSQKFKKKENNSDK